MKNTLKAKIESIPLKHLSILFVLFFIGMLLGAFIYTKFLKKETPLSENKIVVNYPLPVIIEEVRETTKDAKIINVLLTGHGGIGHSGGGLMDSIIVVSVNMTDKKAALISIPRDLWFSGHKINSDPSLKDAITGVTSLPISHSISIDFNSFIKMIDSLGGITVDVKKDYIDNFYPIKGLENELCGFSNEKVAEVHQLYSGFELEKQFTCRYETISYKVGLNEMSGQDALKYVRSRHGDGDFGRSRRQFEVLKAILQKANVSSVDRAFDFVKTDLDSQIVVELLAEIGNPLEYSISSINLSDENVLTSGKSSQGAYILIPKTGATDFNSIKSYIEENL